MDEEEKQYTRNQAEIERIEAEKEHLQALKIKTNLEIEEIRSRKKSKWYRWRISIQAVIAGLVTSGLLATWLIGYWKPIIDVKTEKGLIQNEINQLELELIGIKQDSLDNQNSKLNLEKMSLLRQQDSLVYNIILADSINRNLKKDLAKQKSDLKKLLTSIDDKQSNSNFKIQVQKSINTIEKAESNAKKTSLDLELQKSKILMIKKHYLQELRFDQPISENSNSTEIRKVQEWINLQERLNENWTIKVATDGTYNQQTKIAVGEFQKMKGITKDGIVGKQTFYELTAPLRNAMTKLEPKETFSKTFIAYAKQHLVQNPRELGQNEGPWVRSYMGGNEGRQWPWNVGFVQTVLDQACYTHNFRFTDILPLTYSNDVMGNYALEKNILRRNNSDYIPKPGDIFLMVKSLDDWTHSGIVTAVEGEWIITIEGNTNDEGSREGYEVCKRKRNFKTRNIDFIDIDSVVRF